MSNDAPELRVDEPIVCSACGLEPMVVFTADVLPIQTGAIYATCPYHIDAVIARMQDHVHEVVNAHEGVLVDWWTELHPPEPTPTPEEAA